MSIEEAVGSLKAHEERIKGKIETIEGQLMLTSEEWAKCENEEGKLLLTHEEWPNALARKSLMMLGERGVLLSLVITREAKTNDSNLWYLDNDASNYMTSFKDKFVELDEAVTSQVHFGDGSTVKIEDKRTVVFMCKNGEERALHEVYYIPSLRNNIISLVQMAEDGHKMIIRGEFLKIYDKQGKLLMNVQHSINRLYKIIIETSHRECILSEADETSKLWHA
ncbi:hypothetical protein AgCh_026669 [Apium graveolens]